MKKGRKTRQRILETAVREASTVGFEGLSIGGLAKATDMSKSGLFAHFGSKEDLQVAVLDTARERFVEKVMEPALTRPRGEPRLRALFEGWLDWEEGEVAPGGCPFLVAAWEFDDRPGAVRDEVVRVLAKLAGALEKAVRLGVDAGHFRPDTDTAQVVYELHGIILTFHLHHRLLRGEDSRVRARAAFEALLARVRDGEGDDG
ncbi:MAG: TetR/AcrR family transcriptional regulator [Gemmatimonadota bacterium]